MSWPASSTDVPKPGQLLSGGGQCGGAWYTVGRVVCDKRDKRFTTLAGINTTLAAGLTAS